MISDMHMTTLLALLPDTKLVGQRNWVGGGGYGWGSGLRRVSDSKHATPRPSGRQRTPFLQGMAGFGGFRIPNTPPPALTVGRESLSPKDSR
jgi:hypothetical protein